MTCRQPLINNFFYLFFFFFCVGELFITHTFTCSERSHKCQTEGHPQPKLQATLTTWVEADIKVCQEATCQAKQAAYKAVVHQPTAKPVHFQQTKHHLCLNQPNIAVKIISIIHQQFTGIYHAISAKVRHWAARGLSFLGRVHVAKQVLAASLWYHASFQRPSEQLLKQLSRQLRRFVASAQQASHSDDALALAQGNSQGSAQLPSAAPGAALFPGELTSSLPLSKGGVGLVHVPTQVQALQAKVISRLLEPERLAWKVFQLYRLSQASQVQPLGYGASILFSTLSTDQLQLPARLSAYVTAFRALRPHRLQSVHAMLPQDVLNEPLFFNRQISQPAAGSATTNSACPAAPAAFLTPQQKPLMLSAGITKVAHLQLSLQLQQPQLLALELRSVLLALPPAWRAVVSSAPAATWFQALSASGRQLIQHAQTGQLHTVSPHLQLLQTPSEPVSNPSPVQVISWDPSRPWRGPAHQSAQLDNPLYLQGRLWGPHHLSLGVWGWGSQPAHQLVVRQAGQRLRLIRSFATKHPMLYGW